MTLNKETINIGHLSTAYHTNFILSRDDTIQKELGIRTKWEFFGTGPSMVKAFQENKLDIGYMGLPPAIIGIDKGIPIKCVAGGHVEGTIMTANVNYKTISFFNGSISNTLSQFKGKVIGTPSKGSIHDIIISHYLEHYDLQDDIELRNYPQAEFIGLDMKKGVLDGGVGTPALAVYAKTLLNSHLIIPANYLKSNNPSYGIFMSQDLIQNYPEICKIFLTHHKSASKLLRSSTKNAAKIISKTMEISEKTSYVQDVLNISPKYCIALSKGYLQSTKEFIEILHKLGYIKKMWTIDDVFDFRFIDEIHPEDEHYSKKLQGLVL